MYPRLYIARELLTDDGVIFISIDDNEASQLKLLCDEVFGEDNFVADLLWKRRASSALSENNLSLDHEYVLCYQKGNVSFKGIGKDFKSYRNPDKDARGDWVAGDLTVGMTESMRPNQAYTLIDPETGISYSHNPNRVWAYVPESMKKLLDEKRIIFPSDSNMRPMLKRFKSELKSNQNPFSSLMTELVGLNTEATKQLQDIFGHAYFNYAKPISLLTTLINQITDNKDIILDFFAGSGTTGDAVMQLNAQDGGNRKYILVQIPEAIDPKKNKTAYDFVKNELQAEPTIFEITKERLVRAAKKISQETPDYQGDLGFKRFETLPIFDGYLDNIERLEGEQTELFDGSTLSKEQLEHLLTTWKVYDGIPLTQPLIETDLAGYIAYRHDKLLYLMHQGFQTESLKDFLSKLDATDGDNAQFDIEKIILFGYNFQSKHQLELNEAIRQYKNRKDKIVSLVVRY
jgi:adenine-specific DNA-methyltransferase